MKPSRTPAVHQFVEDVESELGALAASKCRCRVNRPEIRSHPLPVFPGDIPQAVADLMHDTQLNLGVRVNRLNGFR